MNTLLLSIFVGLVVIILLVSLIIFISSKNKIEQEDWDAEKIMRREG